MPDLTAKPEAGPGKFAFTVQALEIAEQPWRVDHVKSSAVVPNAVGGLAGTYPPRDLDPGMRHVLGELEGIGKKIHQHQSQH